MEQVLCYTHSNGDIGYIFDSKDSPYSFDDWRDYLLIADVIKELFQPEQIAYSGITDIRGHFVIDGIRFEFDYDSCFGIFIINKHENLTEAQKATAFQIMNKIWKECVKRKLNN